MAMFGSKDEKRQPDGRNGTPKMGKMEGLPPALRPRDLSVEPQFAMRPPEPPPMSESYAKAMDEWNDMKARLAEAIKYGNDLAASCTVLKRENDRLHAQVERLEEARDTYRRRVWEMESRMDDLAAIAMRIIDTRMAPKGPPPAEVPGEVEGSFERVTVASAPAGTVSPTAVSPSAEDTAPAQ